MPRQVPSDGSTWADGVRRVEPGRPRPAARVSTARGSTREGDASPTNRPDATTPRSTRSTRRSARAGPDTGLAGCRRPRVDPVDRVPGDRDPPRSNERIAVRWLAPVGPVDPFERSDGAAARSGRPAADLGGNVIPSADDRVVCAPPARSRTSAVGRGSSSARDRGDAGAPAWRRVDEDRPDAPGVVAAMTGRDLVPGPAGRDRSIAGAARRRSRAASDGCGRASARRDRDAATAGARRRGRRAGAHGLTIATASPTTTADRRPGLGSDRAAGRRGPSLDGVEVDAHRESRPGQPASGTTRPSASIVAWRRSRLSSAPGTWSRAW